MLGARGVVSVLGCALVCGIGRQVNSGQAGRNNMGSKNASVILKSVGLGLKQGKKV